jgi:CO/xanthine dehydrogenase FAD-binding subunit
MSAAPFEYVRAGSWEEAVSALAEAGEDARVIAGGQSLVPMMMLRLAEPAVLVDIGGAGEPSIDRVDGTLRISALTRHVDLEASAAGRAACAMIPEAASRIGNVRVRHRGTLGGALAHGEPTAEWPCVAVALGATIHVLGPGGARAIPAGELFVTHLTTSLEASEVITSVDLPVVGEGEGSCFVELARRPGDFALVEVAAIVSLDADGRCDRVRLVVGAVGERPVDHSTAAAGLLGEVPRADLVAEAGRAAAAEVDVGPSTHASEDYRRDMVAVLARRALVAALARARGETTGGVG